jgi:H+/Cl- antiporter ClcA
VEGGMTTPTSSHKNWTSKGGHVTAGAAAGIAGGYRLPFTAMAMVLGVGGPEGAQLTSMATVLVAALSGLLTARAANAMSSLVRALWRERVGSGE